MWSDLDRVFEAYERLDPRQRIHPRVCANFQSDLQLSDAGRFRHELRELLEGERESSLSGPERNETGGQKAHGITAPPPSHRGPGTSREDLERSRGDTATEEGKEGVKSGQLHDGTGTSQGPETSHGGATTHRSPATSHASASGGPTTTPQRWWHYLCPCLAPTS
jgi:hypothetical protein